MLAKKKKIELIENTIPKMKINGPKIVKSFLVVAAYKVRPIVTPAVSVAAYTTEVIVYFKQVKLTK